MGDAVETKGGDQAERRAVVNESAILCAGEDVTGEVEIGAGAVDKRCPSLGGGAGGIGGVEHQAAYAGLNERREVPHGTPIDISGSYFVLIGFDTQLCRCQTIRLSIERIAVVDLHAMISGEEIAVVRQYSAAISRGLADSIVSRAFDETTKRLNADFGLIVFTGLL